MSECVKQNNWIIMQLQRTVPVPNTPVYLPLTIQCLILSCFMDLSTVNVTSQLLTPEHSTRLRYGRICNKHVGTNVTFTEPTVDLIAKLTIHK